MTNPSPYAEKILKVSLSDRSISYINTMDYAQRFLGGRGIATALYWEMVPPKCRAFDEDMVKRILGIPPEARPQIILTLGYPDEKPPKPIRHPVTTDLYVNKWRGFWTEEDIIFAHYGEHVRKRSKEIKKKSDL